MESRNTLDTQTSFAFDLRVVKLVLGAVVAVDPDPDEPVDPLMSKNRTSPLR